MKIAAWLLVNVLAFGAAIWLIPGITLDSGDSLSERILYLVVVGLLFGLITSIIKPVLQIISIPLIILTLGFFLLVVNALMLLLMSQISGSLHLGFHVTGFWPAFFGGIVISIASMVIEGVLPDTDQ
ncbi:MAG TPA: phage holin family protein [Marmoricola sp.]|nr:phage holin family protein [Marmoricola sp.]HNI71270.1 phage holin family protein [Marmoricola sp.]HNJ79334.1 phage holin family protein [Marmoricola sp.]HNN48364.1 phage holin family protein [Marmoricola sp.]